MTETASRYVGVSEIADLWGVTRQYVSAKVVNRPDFPEPVARLRMGPVWLREDVERWREDHPGHQEEQDD